ncbi:hypothetical protein phiGT1_69 [Sulfitobacter phage phiGT1]|nr:hypothetical protein phiGT1_69 [Sulfitobacter phage phiGT1]
MAIRVQGLPRPDWERLRALPQQSLSKVLRYSRPLLCGEAAQDDRGGQWNAAQDGLSEFPFISAADYHGKNPATSVSKDRRDALTINRIDVVSRIWLQWSPLDNVKRTANPSRHLMSADGFNSRGFSLLSVQVVAVGAARVHLFLSHTP